MSPGLDLALLAGLFGHALLLSLLAIGGAITVAPDLHRVMVDQQAWLDDAQFGHAIAIAQAAPGPNLLFIPVLGYQVAGLPGALAMLVGILIPSTTLALAALRLGQTHAHHPALRAFKAGMAPITLGLMLATGIVLAPWDSPPGLLLAGAVALLVWRTRVHLLVLIAAGVLLGVLGWV